MNETTCHDCQTQDFTDGFYQDLDGTQDDRHNLFCLACGVTRELAGRPMMIVPTADQLAALRDWDLAGVGAN